MNHIIKISSAVLLSALMMVGCSSKEVSHVGVTHVENMTSHQMHSAIMHAGKAEGWKMTEFKNNEATGLL